MKIKKLVAGLILSSIMGVGALSFGLSKISESKPVEAASTATEIFINTAGISDWESGAETMAWVSGGGQTNKWIMTSWIENNIRKFTLPANYTTITLCRFSSSNHPADQSTYWWNDNWGQAWDFTPGDNLNYMSLTGWSDGKASYSTGYVKHFVSGNKVYVDMQGNESWWFDGYKTYFYTAVGNLKKWHQMTRIGSSNMLSYTFTSDVYADLAIVVRNNAASFDGRTNQTTDITYDNTNYSKNAFKLGVDDYGTTPVTGMEVFSDAYVADSYGYYFLHQSICKDSGGLVDGATTAWSNASSVYTSQKALLSNQNYIKTASSAGSANINKAMLRYDTALAKNPTVLTNDFIGRSGGSYRTTVNPLQNNNESSVNIATVVVISIASLTAIGGYFFLRKRKED